MKRRDFLRSTVAGSVVGQLAQTGALASSGKTIPKRRYRDNIDLSIIGFGGIVVCKLEQKEADRRVSEAFDRGVNYFDVAPTYFDGEAEMKLGVALKPYRQKSFLACKTTQRMAEGAQMELDRSLQRLNTDHFDLYQFHAVTTMDDVEKILGPGGAGEVFLKARQQGKVKYLGMSAHSVEAALAMMDRFKLDSILFPINYACFAEGDFGPQILQKAKEKGIARLALKALAHQKWPAGVDAEKAGHPKCWYEPIEDRELARKALSFTLSEEITAAIPPGDEKIFSMALELAADFKPISAADRTELLASAKGLEPVFRHKA